ncbi:MAG: TIR domain-containing protein [Chloroflexota bacterium]
MTDIFISYANEDRDSAARLAARLESVGWRVWWDRRIPAGRTWRAVLADALSDTRSMVVLWSAHSVESPWVAEEAEEARRLGKTLVPILIERVEPPMGFRTIQAADLAEWDGAPDDPAVQQLVADLKSLLGAPREPSYEPRKTVEPTPRQGPFPEAFSHHWPKAAASCLAIVVIFAMWQYWPLPRQGADAPVAKLQGEHPEATPPLLESLSVRASRRTLKPSETLRLTATGRYADGSEKDVEDGIEWSSSDRRVATIDENGEARALQSGTTNIVAKVGAVASAEWTLGVEAAKPSANPAMPRLVALKISSNQNQLFENEKIALRVKGKYSDESEKDISGAVAWQSSDRAVASINVKGELQGLKPGRVEVVARAQNLSSAPETFQVKEAHRGNAAQPKPVKLALPAAQPAGLTEQAKAKIVDHLNRAQTYREQGNYAAALAELEQARLIDRTSAKILQEIEQTKRACNAEKVLGNKPNC